MLFPQRISTIILCLCSATSRGVSGTSQVSSIRLRWILSSTTFSRVDIPTTAYRSQPVNVSLSNSKLMLDLTFPVHMLQASLEESIGVLVGLEVTMNSIHQFAYSATVRIQLEPIAPVHTNDQRDRERALGLKPKTSTNRKSSWEASLAQWIDLPCSYQIILWSPVNSIKPTMVQYIPWCVFFFFISQL